MYLRSLAVTLALAIGLLVILALAFFMAVPAYIVSFINPPQLRPRGLTPKIFGG